MQIATNQTIGNLRSWNLGINSVPDDSKLLFALLVKFVSREQARNRFETNHLSLQRKSVSFVGLECCERSHVTYNKLGY